jgi:hypothetical protein
MSSAARKWAVGCGIGCGLALLVVILAVAGGYFGIKNIARAVDESTEAMNAVQKRFGSAWDYCPDPAGTVSDDRVEAFLAVRDATAARREGMEGDLAALSEAESEASPASMARAMKAGFGLVPAMMGYFTDRNRAYLDFNLGPGEYLFLYAVTYYSWLGKSPADGPPFVIVGDDQGHRRLSEEEIREQRLAEAGERVNRPLLRMLRNQLAALGEDREPASVSEWRRRLEDEIRALESDPRRVPWQDGLPEALSSSLEPYRERLEASYSELCNPIELQGSF